MGMHVADGREHDVEQWLNVVGSLVLRPEPNHVDHIDTALTFRCDAPQCLTGHHVGLNLPVDSAALLVASIRVYADRAGLGGALTAAIDQATATIRDNLPEASDGAH